MKQPGMKSVSRRRVLALGASALISKVFAATLPRTGPAPQFDVDRLLSGIDPASASGEPRTNVTRYVAGASVTLFSIPLVSRASVGSGFAVIEEAESRSGRTLSIQFGAGSTPDRARGLNRLGFIQEAILEESGNPTECAWLAFMTTSQEKSLDQAERAIATTGPTVPYTASQGAGLSGKFRYCLQRLEFPSHYTWRDAAQLVERAKEAMMGQAEAEAAVPPANQARPATFLYCVHRAMLDPRPQTTGHLVFNGKHFQLDARKEPDETATAWFAGRNLLQSPSSSVTRLNAVITAKLTGEKTPFRLWYEAGREQMPPLRFEYQAKSFLRLTFEADVKAETPPIHFALKKSKENA
jgi:hypothetical protein